MQSSLADNLRFLCTHYRSVSEACRRMGINRQQFTRYLAGAATPSPASLKRICDHFGVDEAEVALPPPAFRNLFRRSPLRRSPRAVSELMSRLDGLLAASDPRLAEYSGWYDRWFMSFSTPGMVLRSVLRLGIDEGVGWFSALERVAPPGGTGPVYRYRGLAMFLRERIFMVGGEVGRGHELIETVLYPSYRVTIGLLPGLILGVAARGAREPAASRCVLAFAGRRVNPREMLARAGLYAPDDPAVPAPIRRAITNTVGEDEPLFRALPDVTPRTGGA